MPATQLPLTGKALIESHIALMHLNLAAYKKKTFRSGLMPTSLTTGPIATRSINLQEAIQIIRGQSRMPADQAPSVALLNPPVPTAGRNHKHTSSVLLESIQPTLKAAPASYCEQKNGQRHPFPAEILHSFEKGLSKNRCIPRILRVARDIGRIASSFWRKCQKVIASDL